MSDINDLQITVKKIIKSTGRGILVLGHVDNGIVHLRDILQAHNHQPGATARAGRLYKSGKKIEEAQAGDDIKILLERIEETDIHPDDKLRLGEKKDLRPVPKKDLHITGKESWKQLPERIEPILHLRQFAGKIAWLIIIGFFLLAPIIFKDTNFQGWGNIVFLIVWYLLFGYSTFRAGKDLIRGSIGRNKFLNNRSQTNARILNRRVVEHDSKYSTTYTYHLKLEFTPTRANVNSGAMQLEAQISEKIYKKLKKNETINITYAVEDPRIFLIEGE